MRLLRPDKHVHSAIVGAWYGVLFSAPAWLAIGGMAWWLATR